MSVKSCFDLCKKGLSFVLILAIIFSLLPSVAFAGTASTAWFDNAAFGTGVEYKPYILSTADDLAGLAQLVNNGNSFENQFLKIDNTVGNLDLSGYGNWTPIGTIENPFKGSFDGSAMTISGLTIDDVRSFPADKSNARGLFGCIGNNGAVKNLFLQQVNITVNHGLSMAARISPQSTATNYTYVGAIAGVNEGKISGCNIQGTFLVDGSNVAVGGIVGSNGSVIPGDRPHTGSIAGCGATNITLTVSGAGDWVRLGGIAGVSSIGAAQTYFISTIQNCISQGIITGSASGNNEVAIMAGGLAGELIRTNVISNYVNVAVNIDSSASKAYAGGFVGKMDYSQIWDSGSKGNVNANGKDLVYGGGLVGLILTAGSVNGVYAMGNVTAQAAESEESVESKVYAGGLAGALNSQMQAVADIHSCFAYGDVSAQYGHTNISGGFLGEISYGVVKSSYSIGDAISEGDSYRLVSGGFIGDIISRASFFNSYAAGTASTEGTSEIEAISGGFYGRVDAISEIYGTFYKSEGNGPGVVIPEFGVTLINKAMDLYAMTDDQVLTRVMAMLSEDFIKNPNQADELYLPELSRFAGSSNVSLQQASKKSVTVQPPFNAALSPVSGAAGVEPGTNLTLTFNANVSPNPGKAINIYRADNDSLVENISVIDGSRVSINGGVVTINPSADLYYNGEYYVLVDSGAFIANTGKSYGGIGDEEEWRFETQTRGEVTAGNSQALSFYMENDAVTQISLTNGVRYNYNGGTISRNLSIEGNGAVIYAGTGVLDDVIRADGVTVTGLGNYTGVKVFLKVEDESVLTLTNLTLMNTVRKNGINTSDDGLFTVINVKSGGALFMDRVTLGDFHNNPVPGEELCFGIHSEPGAITTNITNSNFEFTSAFRNVVAIRDGAFLISDNTFRGTLYPEKLRQSDGYEYAVYIYGGNGEVTGNTFIGFDSTTQDGYASSGVAATGFYRAEYVIDNNTFSGNSYDIDLTTTWSNYTTNRFMQVNGMILEDSQQAYELGQSLEASNGGAHVTLTLDQNDLILLTDPEGDTYQECFGGYRGQYLTVAEYSPEGVVLHLPTEVLDGLKAADDISFEVRSDSNTQWIAAQAEGSGGAGLLTEAAITLAPGHQYHIRAKLTHTQWTDDAVPAARTLVTYSNPVTVGDTTPPLLNQVNLNQAGMNEAEFSFFSNEEGSLYYLVLPADEETPNNEEVKNNGTLWEQKVINGRNTFSVTNLVPETDYKIYLVAEDEYTNLSLVSKVSFTTASLPVTVTSVTVKSAPNKTTYTEGEALDLAGLTITLNKSDFTTEDVAFANFGSRGIASSPENGTILTTGDAFVNIAHTASGVTLNVPITVNADNSNVRYSITVLTDGNGTASASADTALPGETVTLVTTPDSGFLFSSWEIVSGNIRIGDGAFKMPASDVTVRALFRSTEPEPEPEHQVPGMPTQVTAVAGNGSAAVSFTAPSDDGGSPVTAYTVYVYRNGVLQDNLTVTGAAGSPVIVTGLTNGAGYTFTVIAVNVVGAGSESVQSQQVVPYAPPSNEDDENNNGSTNSGSTGNSSVDTVVVLVNGRSENAGTATTVKQGTRTVTTVIVDEKKLEQKLAEEGDRAVVTIPVLKGSDTAVGQLNGWMVKNMEDRQAVLEIMTNDAIYTLPAGQIDIGAISDKLGGNVSLAAIKVSIEIIKSSDETVALVENAAAAGQFALMLPPVEFTVRCSVGDETVEVENFTAYVERRIAIPDGVDPNRITTGVIVDPDGVTSRHVPTKVVIENGRYFAVINSLTNSIYSVVWHPLEFEDAANHWAKEAINDMGSRMVMSGVDGQSQPDRNITRAEFAVIMVKALGLKPGTGSNPYQDVKIGDWYLPYIETAHAYGIISGYGNNTFGPNDTITREQAIAIIARAMSITGLDAGLTPENAKTLLSAYTDSIDSSTWARESLAACLKTGIVSGTAADKLSPGNAVTRGEVAVMVRLLLMKSDLI